MDTQTTRRGVLGAIGLAVPVAIAGGASASPLVLAVDRLGWDRAFAHWKAAHAAYMLADAEHDAAFKIFEGERPSQDMIPWAEFPFSDRRYLARVADLNELERLERVGCLHASPETLARRLASIDKIREFRLLEQETSDRHRIDYHSERTDETTDVVREARDALLAIPAPDAAALHWKFEMLFPSDRDENDHSDFWPMPVINVLRADIRRLLPQKA